MCLFPSLSICLFFTFLWTIIIWEGSFDGYEIEDYLKNNMSRLTCDTDNPLKYFAFSIDEQGNDDYYVNSQCDLFGYIDSDLYGN